MRRSLVAGLVVIATVWIVTTQLRTFRVQFLGVGNVILQKTEVTCGPASLSYVLKTRGINVTEEELVGLAGTDSNGTTFLGLASAAKSLGVPAHGITASFDDLHEIELPAIALVQGHLVVVTAVTESDVTVADPLVGVLRYGRRAFERVWSRNLLVFGTEGDK